ncbi:aldehyde dehydrogenase family protein [Massilia cavernae]|uniref:Aldehyde dehydrogenase family protein n=1 Tax=Massilia cavernae TaxID=2320864 RepID=A0A418Y5K7_9BURK|nr:aldehyde dehydrogenase family protein [Massilia cavernae]
MDSQLATLSQGFLAKTHQLFIDGQWHAARGGQSIEVRNPANGQVFAQVAAGEAADIDLAVQAARRAFEGNAWRALGPAGRARLLLKLADAIEANADELALLESLDNGKPVRFARMMDVGGAAECLRYNAGWATKLFGETINLSFPGQWQAYTLREPVGVVGQIVPWNFPLAMAVGKIAPALAAGCTVVLKPAEQTPLTAVRLAELIAQVGFPPGVFNLVTGFGLTAGKALAEHPGVDKVSFTGSTLTGKSILAAAAGNLKRVTLELGGKSPTIVFPDADIEKAIDGAARSIFSNSGQICAAGSRLYVHKDVFDRVVEGVAERAAKLKVGHGLAPDTEIGPLVSQQQLDRVSAYVRSGERDGAEVLTGGKVIDGEGYFIQPTVLTQTRADMAVVREEIFGPVLCAMPFEGNDLAQIAALANDTEYGLSATVWTRDLSTAHKMIHAIRAGSVKVNAGGLFDNALPMGGMKQSGWGRENGREGIEVYTEIKSVAIGL